MKKILLLLTLLLVFSTAYTQKFYVGVKGGINSSTLTGKDTAVFDKKRLPGFQIGALVNIGVSDVLSLQPELTYSRQGLDGFVKSGVFKGLYFKAHLNYINLVVLAKTMFGGESVRFFANAGPYVGYMISGSNILYDNIGGEAETKYDFVSIKKGADIERLDFGAAAGVGATFRAGPGDVVIDLRYNLGFVTVSEIPLFKKYTNSVFNGSIGYVVPLGDFY